jgi:hypothetical protein
MMLGRSGILFVASVCKAPLLPELGAGEGDRNVQDQALPQPEPCARRYKLHPFQRLCRHPRQHSQVVL